MNTTASALGIQTAAMRPSPRVSSMLAKATIPNANAATNPIDTSRSNPGPSMAARVSGKFMLFILNPFRQGYREPAGFAGGSWSAG